MKHVVKWMLVWVISFSLVLPAGVAKADIDLDVVDNEIRLKEAAEKETRKKEHQRGIIAKAIADLKTDLTSKLDGLRGKSSVNPLNDVRDDYVQALGKVRQPGASTSDYRSYDRAKATINNAAREITYLAERLQRKCEEYSAIGGINYEWTDLREELELNEDNTPIVKDREGVVIRFSHAKWDAEAEETEAAPKGEVKKAEALEGERGSDSWSRIFGRVDDDDDDREDPRSARESARTDFVGCTLPEHNPAYDNGGPSSGERAFGLGALTLFGIGAGVLAGVNTSYLYKERKSLRHQMERASANGDSPFLYHGAYAALNYQNPLGGLGETLGPISMAISSILMPGNQGYLSQMEYLRNMRLRAIADAMAQARVNTNVTQSSTRKIEIQRNLQGLDNISKSLFGDVNDLSDKIDGAFKNIGEQLTGGMSQSELNQAIRSINNMSQGLSVLGGLKNMFDEAGDRIKKEVAEAAEAAKNAQNAINSNGGFTQTIEQTSSGRFSSNRSGLTTGPNGFLGAPGFPQTGGGISFGARFGSR